MVIEGEIVKPENGVEWKIKDFFCASGKKEDWYYSPVFSLNNTSWKFVLYLNQGNSSAHGYVELSLRREPNLYPPISTEISVSLKTVNGQKEHKRCCIADFDWYKTSHYIPEFISRSELIRRKTELVPSDVLTVLCTLKILESTESTSGNATGECSYCKENFDAETLLSHEKKCMDKPMKCPYCLKVLLLQKWLCDHECQKERTEGVESLCQDFKNVLLDGCNHDLILKIDEREFKAHRDVLRARSRVFKSMLTHEMLEKNSGVINVPDCNPQAMEQFLFYVYSGKTELIDQGNMLGLYYIADKYEMSNLKEECSKFIKSFISPTNFCDVIQLALNHSDTSLLEFATEYFMNNMLDILNTVEWQSFLKDNSTTANELLVKSCKRKT